MITAVSLLQSCRTVMDDREHYLRWFAKNGYYEQVEREGKVYSCFFRSPAFRAAQLADADNIDSLSGQYASNLTFTYGIGPAESSDQLTAADMAAHQMPESEHRKDFLLITDGDTISPQLAYLEKGFELASKRQYTLAFDHKYERGQKYRLIHRPMDGTAPIELTIKPDHNIPALDI